jgi:putative PIN family toxin of toxin-antitoxin system
MRAVLDTGVPVSALIRRQGTTGSVLRALRDGHFLVVYTTDILVEIIDVLGRNNFRRKYQVRPDDINVLIQLIRLRGELVIPQQRVNACREPQNDKFLEAALSGDADCIVSGDGDLLDMGSFEGIPIIRPAEFLARLQFGD